MHVPKSLAGAELEKLTRRREQLVTMRRMEKNHLEGADQKSIESIREVTALLSTHIATIESEIK